MAPSRRRGYHAGHATGSIARRPLSTPARPLIDVAVLAGLVGDDPRIVREFLADYQASVGRLATALPAARAADDVRQIVAIAQKLKASSRAVGVVALGDRCAELENACRTGTREGISRAIQFEAALVAVDAGIAHLLARFECFDSERPDHGRVCY